VGDTERQTASRNIAPAAAMYSVVFVCFYLYVLLRVDPALHHDWMRPVFYFTGSFFRETFAGGPGGPTKYLAGFLLGCYRYPYLGALVITAIAILICAAAHALIATVDGARARLAHFVPAVCLLILQNDYSYPTVGVGLGLLAALACSLIYVKLPVRRAAIRLPIFLMLSAALYYLVAGPYLIFVALGAMHEIFAARRVGLGLFCLLPALAVPYVAAMWFFVLEIPEAYGRSWYLSPLAPTLALYLFFPVSLLVPAVAAWMRRRRKEPTSAPGKSTRATRRKPAQSRWAILRKPAFRAPIFFAAAAAWVFVSFDSGQKNFLQIHRLARLEDWPRVLAHGRGLRAGTPTTIASIIRALYHTGRLPSDMFEYPQMAIFGVLPQPANASDFFHLSLVLGELGHATYAQKWAYEALEETRDDPLVLRQLAFIHLLKGETQAGRTVLNLLAASPFDRAWATRQLARLDADPSLSSDTEIVSRRPLLFAADYVRRYPGTESLLQMLLLANPHNQMAFEYLMAHYLLTRRPEKVVENLSRMSDFRYPELPRHWEEALLLQEALSGVRTPFPGLRIRMRTRERFAEFSDAVVRYGNDVKGAQSALVKTHGDTFWYYYAFSRSGIRPSSSEAAGR
jgi:hypothetical protein